MHRFFVTDSPAVGERLAFPPGTAHQMTRVLRLRPGERVIAIDPGGWELVVELLLLDGRFAEGRVTARGRPAVEPPLRVLLAQGLPKGDKMDWIVQKCTEAGVAEFHPVVTRRTVANPAGKEEARRQRWGRIAREAAEQSGRTRVPAIAPVRRLEEAVAELGRADLFMVAWEGAAAVSLKDALRERAAVGFEVPEPAVSLLVGPEGGLEPEEVDLARRHGAIVVSLGPRTLRTETAGLMLAGLVLYELGDLG